MEITQAILVSLMCYLAAEGVPWLGGDFGGFYVFSRPLVSGPIVGLIYGDIQQGIIIGVAVQAVYLSLATVGGVAPADITFAAYPAIAIAMATNATPEVAVSVAAAIGVLGTVAWNGMMLTNTFWNNLTAKHAENGNERGVVITHAGLTQVTTFLWRFGLSFVLVYFGTGVADWFLQEGPAEILKVLGVLGGILPAVGIAMILNLILDKKFNFIYFLLGYIAVTYLSLPILAVAIVGVALAYFAYIRSGPDALATAAASPAKTDMEEVL